MRAHSLGAAIAGMALSFGPSYGQVDVSHIHAEARGGVLLDLGRGVGVWHDGSVVHATELDSSGPKIETELAIWSDTVPHLPVYRVFSSTGDMAPRGAVRGRPDARGSPQFPEPNLRYAFVPGWFSGEFAFHNAGTVRNGYVMRIFDNEDTQTPIEVDWFAHFASEEPCEALAAAQGPDCGIIPGGGGGGFGQFTSVPAPPGGGYTDCRGISQRSLAVGGYISGETTFPQPASAVIDTNGLEDGFIAILEADSGSLFQEGHVLAIGGLGNDRVTAIAIDDADHSIVAAGYFSRTVDFDPSAGSELRTAVGGTDIFVARYQFDPQTQEIGLDWVHTTGTEGDDRATGVAIGAQSEVYAVGSKSTGPGKTGIWITRLSAIGGVGWDHLYGGQGNDAAMAITLDGLGRPLVTGCFGLEPEPEPTGPEYCLDFDPTGGTDFHCTGWGRLDVFVTRLDPSGLYDWTYTLGGEYLDCGYAVAVDPVDTGRIAHAGWFGAPDAPSTYQVDFDPGPGSAPLTTSGAADAFFNILAPSAPTQTIKAEVSIVLDGSSSVDPANYTELMTVLRKHIPHADVIPQDGSVAMNVVIYGVVWRPELATPLIPWTVVTPETAFLIATQLSEMTRPSGSDNYMAGGVKLAAAGIDGNNIDGFYRQVFVIADEVNDESFGTIASAKAYAMLRVDQINGLAVNEPSVSAITREWFGENLVDSVVKVTPNAFPFEWEDNLGIAAQVDAFDPVAAPDFSDVVRRILMRITVCPGDYDRDGDVDLADDDLFGNHWSGGSDPCQPTHPLFPLWCMYADWNFDGGHGSDPWEFDHKFPGSFGVGCP